MNRIDQSDSKQLRLVFDSMDKNRDGQLSREELEEFAIELGQGLYSGETFEGEKFKLSQILVV